MLILGYPGELIVEGDQLAIRWNLATPRFISRPTFIAKES